MADLPDMGAMEQALRALMSDPHYLAMIDQPGVTELFIDGTTQDAFFLSMFGG